MVKGRAVLRRADGATCVEHHVTFDGRHRGVILEVAGAWSVVTLVESLAPPPNEVPFPGRTTLQWFGWFGVVDKGEMVFESAEGELPFRATLGSRRLLVSLREERVCAFIDYGEHYGDVPGVFVGFDCAPQELQLVPDAPATDSGYETIRCCNCNVSRPIVGAPTVIFGCYNCGTILDRVSWAPLARQAPGSARIVIKPGITLYFGGLPWIAAGVSCRSESIRSSSMHNDSSSHEEHWTEYLLYSTDGAIRWVSQESDGTWWLKEPLDPREMAEASIDSSVYVRGLRYDAMSRHEHSRPIDRQVVGECPRRVTLGVELGDSRQYEHGEFMRVRRELTHLGYVWVHAIGLPGNFLGRVLTGPGLPLSRE